MLRLVFPVALVQNFLEHKRIARLGHLIVLYLLNHLFLLDLLLVGW